MRILRFSFCIATIFLRFVSFPPAAAAGEAALVKIGFEIGVSQNGEANGVLTEYFASKEDIDASYGWKPGNAHFLLSLDKVIERAKKFVTKPEDKLVRLPPILRGIDLRQMEGNLWYWKVYLASDLDPKNDSNNMIRDGEFLSFVMILPNGGQIRVSERKMTSKERAYYGLDTPPDTANPLGDPPAKAAR